MQYVSADSFVADLVELYLEFPEVRKLKTTDALIFTFELGQHFKQLKIFMKSAAFLRAQRLEKEFVTKFTDYMNICRKLIYGD